jgi:hypothetical protein
MESSRFASNVLDNLPAALTPVNSIAVNGLVLRQFCYWVRPYGSTRDELVFALFIKSLGAVCAISARHLHGDFEGIARRS